VKLHGCACAARPYLDEAHPDGAHLGELVHGLKAVVDRLGQKLSELLVVENLEAAPAGDLAHGGRVEAVVVIAVTALDENAGVTEALGVHLPSHVVQVHSWETDRILSGHPGGGGDKTCPPSRTFADVPARVLDGGVAVDVGQQAEAEAVLVVRRVGEAVHQHARRRGVVSLADAVVKFVVDDGAPVARLLVLHRLHI